MNIAELMTGLGEIAPFQLQESYDNSGLQVGDPGRLTEKALICLDMTAEVLEEAIRSECDLIISHHPLLFNGIRSVSSQTETGRILIRAIRQGIAIVSMHTNLDNVHGGVNTAFAAQLGLENLRILQPMEKKLSKIVTFCPTANAGDVRKALFDAGCGRIGNYDSCSFNVSGQGSFRALEGADPFVGEMGELHFEEEVRIEAIFQSWQEGQVVSSLLKAHPYEEVAYDVYSLLNMDTRHGAGMIGSLPEPLSPDDFLAYIKERLELSAFRFSGGRQEDVLQVAICGGSGSFLIDQAKRSGAHAFITGDIKYHQFFDTGSDMLLCDVGHYESERFILGQLKALILKKFPTFAVLISETNANPVKHIF